ncbi:hypothetical protein MRX96_022913 [Rhipicephalus microplus]
MEPQFGRNGVRPRVGATGTIIRAAREKKGTPRETPAGTSSGRSLEALDTARTSVAAAERLCTRALTMGFCRVLRKSASFR